MSWHGNKMQNLLFQVVHLKMVELDQIDLVHAYTVDSLKFCSLTRKKEAANDLKKRDMVKLAIVLKLVQKKSNHFIGWLVSLVPLVLKCLIKTTHHMYLSYVSDDCL